MIARGQERVLRRRSAGVLVGAAAVLCALLVRPPAAAALGTVSVRGTITDESGAPVPAHAVRLLKARTILDLRSFRTRDQNAEELRATSDAHGFFEFQFPVDSGFRYYYLRFYDPNDFDVVKYRLPEDREISRRVRQGRPVLADVVLRFHPDWPQVKAMIDAYGPGSHCGQVLRALGLPGRRIPQGGGRELWEYPAAGVSYLVEGSKVLETRHALASAGLGTEAPPPSGTGPVPAERVEERP